MIYKFKSKAAGDVIMLGPNGQRVLELIGKSPDAQGIIEPAAMLAAIDALTAAVQADEALRAQAAAGDDSVPRPEAISLRQRAWPLVDMMKRAHAAQRAHHLGRLGPPARTMRMDATRVIAVRHGETAWNVDTRLQGQLDVPLNDTGREQARRMAAALRHDAPDVIYSSDLSRARETAEAAARALGLPLRTDAGLRERCFGIWQGHTYAEVEQRWPEQSERWRRRESDFGPAEGETLQGFYERAVATATRLAAAHPGQNLLLVAHGGVLDCLYRAASRLPLNAPRTWELPNTGINRLLFTGSGFTLVGWGDVHHLDDDALDESNDPAGQTA